MTSSVAERLLARSIRDGGCLRWSGAKNNKGYGVIGVGAKKLMLTHRAAYEAWVGSIPEGYEIDHVKARGCLFRDCCEPTHLEAVTRRENLRRVRRDRCGKGHLLEGVNLQMYVRPDGYEARVCRACVKQRNDHRPKKEAHRG